MCDAPSEYKNTGSREKDKISGSVAPTEIHLRVERPIPRENAQETHGLTTRLEQGFLGCRTNTRSDWISEPVAASTKSNIRTVKNIDNAPRLWKSLPLPQGHLYNDALTKSSEDSVYVLPRVLLTMATALCAILPLAAAAVTIALGLSWPFELILSWLTTMALTLTIQCLLMETIFLFCHALFCAFRRKKPPDERNLLHALLDKVSFKEEQGATYFVDDLDETDRELIPRPPTEEERREAREKAGRDRELEQVLVMIVFDVLFLLLLLIIGLGNRDLYSFPTRKAMENAFNPSRRFSNVSGLWYIFPEGQYLEEESWCHLRNDFLENSAV